MPDVEAGRGGTFGATSPRNAWEGVAVPGRSGLAHGGPGVRATLWIPRHIATVTAGPGRAAALSDAAEPTLGGRLPLRPRTVEAGGTTFVWSGPGQWLAISRRPDLVPRLIGALPEASVADQSGARAILSLSGTGVREVLEKGSMVDLHPRAFAVGDVAVTTIAHVGVQLWQVDDAPRFDIAVSRSFAGSFWSWLGASAAPLGFTTEYEPA